MKLLKPRALRKELFFIILISIFFYCPLNVQGSSEIELKVKSVMDLLQPQDVKLSGLLNGAIEASHHGRLKTFITGTESMPVAIFRKDSVKKATKLTKRPDGEDWTMGSGWLGEHVGKWMITASRAAIRTDDKQLNQTIHEIADYLVTIQESDGYIGTYAPSARFTADILYPARTWDVWIHTYIILGLLEVNRYWPNENYVKVAKKAADLVIEHFGKGSKKSLAYYGNHVGLSGTIILEAFVELYKSTGEQRYTDFAEHIIQQAEDRTGLQIVSQSLKEMDMLDVGDGKIYQICWNYVGIAKLYEITGNSDYLKAALHGWTNFYEDHLTLGNSPWGGIGIHGECVNEKGYFNPSGWVETCNTMAWIQLNRTLLRITGEAKYADTIEKAIYNSLLGAQYPNGEDWCYFIFPNGRRHKAIWRDCCKASGALSLEEIAPLIYGKMGDGIAVNLYTASEGTLKLPQAGLVTITQQTDYPHDEQIKITVNLSKKAEFSIFIRIPDWVEEAAVTLNGKSINKDIQPGIYLKIQREWKKGDKIILTFPMKLRVHKKNNANFHRNREIQSFDYFAVTRGPLVYATDLIDGYKFEETLRLPKENPERLFSPASTPDGLRGTAFQLKLPNREPIVYVPYYETGGRKDGAWRLTWIGVHWE